jgi:hypothetical protein
LNYKNERICGIFLLIVFILISAYILKFPHYFVHEAPDKRPTYPDEDVFYFWALLYNEGRYAVPIQDWYGGECIIEFKVRADGLHYIRSAIYPEGNTVTIKVYYNDRKVSDARVVYEVKRGIFEKSLPMIMVKSGFTIYRQVGILST